MLAELGQVLGTEVQEIMMFPMAPNAFDGIEAAEPTRVTQSRLPRVLMQRTQNPGSGP
jgi:hypothetical protein